MKGTKRHTDERMNDRACEALSGSAGAALTAAPAYAAPTNSRRTARVAGMAAISAVLVIALALNAAPPARAQSDGGELPRTTIAPAESGGTLAPPPGAEVGAPAAGEPAGAPPPVHHHTVVHRTGHASSARPANEHVEVEPANARLLLKSDAWAYERPSKWSKTVERVHAGKYIDVTGTTRYYLRAKLKGGKLAYVPAGAAQLVKPSDQIFRLTSNAAVLAEPNHWAKKLSEVHRGHDVHVVGVSLNYVKIKMKDGLEGFIPMSAMQ